MKQIIHEIEETNLECFYSIDNNNKSFLEFANQGGKAIEYMDLNLMYLYSKDCLNVERDCFIMEEFKRYCKNKVQKINYAFVKSQMSIINRVIGRCLNFSILIIIKNKNRKSYHNEQKQKKNVCSIDVNIIIKFSVQVIDRIESFTKEFMYENEEMGIDDYICKIIEKLVSTYNKTLIKNKIISKFEKTDIIFPAGIGGILAHEAIGHCLEADNILDDDSKLRGLIWKKISHNSKVSISDMPICNSKKTDFSDDGTVQKTVNLVKDGFLTGIMTDAKSAKYYGVEDTGNGMRGSYSDLIIPRMRKTLIHEGNEREKDIIKETNEAVLITEISNASVMPELGKFVIYINKGILIRNGEMVALTDPFLYNDDIFNVLDRIDRMGDRLVEIKANCLKKIN